MGVASETPPPNMDERSTATPDGCEELSFIVSFVQTGFAHRPALMMKYDIVNSSSAFSSEQIRALLDKYQKRNTDSPDLGLYTDDACMNEEHPPAPGKSEGEVTTTCGKEA